MALDFMCRIVLYFVMAVLQLIAVCLVVILCDSVLACLSMVANFSIHCWCSIWFVGRGMILMVGISSRDFISGLLWRGIYECWRIAFQMVWWIFSWCFHSFCCFLGRNPPWALLLWGVGTLVVLYKFSQCIH